MHTFMASDKEIDSEPTFYQTVDYAWTIHQSNYQTSLILTWEHEEVLDN